MFEYKRDRTHQKPISAEERKEMQRLHAQGFSASVIGRRMNRVKSTVIRAVHPERDAFYREKERLKKRKSMPKGTIQNWVHSNNGRQLYVPPEVLAERDRRLSRWPTDLTAYLMGDPIR